MTRTRWPLVALTLLATLLQFHALGAQSLWYDEGFSVWLAQKPPAEIVARTAADIQPPLYYLLLHGWIALVGTGEVALRLFSALAAVLAVPLTGQLAVRLLRYPEARPLAALIVAISPLWLWYGREVRMYALLLALLLSAALALLALLRGERRAVLPFAFLTAAAAYTHYFAWFVIGAWGAVALLRTARAGDPRRWRALGIAFGLSLLAYLPWVGVALRRLSEDRSYWEGTLRPAEVVAAALASWMAGHSLFEGPARLAGAFGALVALLGLAVVAGRAQRRDGAPWPRLPRLHSLLLLAWLLGPFLGLLAISWNRPKYHPRYLIFAAPAFLLLQVGLLSWLFRRGWAGRAVGTLLTTLLLTLSLVADYNLFRNPAFAKDDWRGVAAFLRANRAPEEPLLLVSGHAFPILEYYYPDPRGVIRLPERPTLDTTAVLGPESGPLFAEALGAAPRVWTVEWEEEVVDPEEVVQTFLRAAGGQREPVPGYFGVGLEQWSLPADGSMAGLLDPRERTDTRFGDALRLIGWSPPLRPAPADGGLAATLFWAAQRPLTGDYKMNLRVVDGAGAQWGALDQRPTSYLFPTFRWEAGAPRLAALEVPLEPGTPPGDYWLLISVYEEGGPTLDLLDETGAPQGQALRLGPLRVEAAADGWRGAHPPASASAHEVPMLGGTTLLASEVSLPERLEPGQRLPVALWWRTGGPLPGAMLHLAWEQGGAGVGEATLPPGGAGWPGEAWQASDLLLTQAELIVPRDLPAGPVRLLAWLSDGTGAAGEPVALGEGTAAAVERTFEPPPMATTQRATFGGEIELLGFDLDPALPAPGERATLTLHWRARAGPGESLTLFAHPLTADGRIVAGGGEDALPLGGARPTDSWVAGEVLSIPLTLAIPADAPPGPYEIEVGWYNAAHPDLPRLPAEGEGADGNRVLLRLR